MKKKSKVLFITSSFPKNKNNNDGYFIYELANELSSQFNIHILCPHSHNLKKDEKIDDIQVFRFQYFFKKFQSLTAYSGILEGLKKNRFNYLLIPFFFLSQIITTINLIRKEKYDLVHIHWLIPQGICYFLAKQFFRNSPPFIVTSHGSDINQLNHTFLIKLKKQIIKEALHFITVSHSLKKACQIKLGIKETKIKTIPTGINSKIFINKNQSRKDDFLFVGRLIESKGILLLLESMKKLIREGHTTRTLSIVGHGPLIEQINEFIQKNNLARNVFLIGHVRHNEVADIYNQHKILISPALVPEGLGLTTIEAMACGCIPIVTDIPALNEIVINNYSGYTFPENNMDALSHIMQHSIENYLQLEHIIVNAQVEVSKKYAWKSIAEEYSNLYRNAITPQN
ncbi:MAG: glycosyltransferase family 4 protein [gamma proteobacterium symbiont of Bathyaustriella thionipta]|nr:glycosyltransferase family 4 protein [gamma proteobacterium symbiont of Bathyaustriella thionipta]MCU7948698.1 glycosyltransferase family 4 protein [gamma proteobacterium symbiont of Bathyaustriella thionipta]MCU7953875.1 glycosyltransferase family 4 protein [gamma proteobacterium symbiont of Bathyaustriella thionipta]MCU7955029.1 glycosyltransferase family 4 protein [gamma proteobacterium symbiont of Bathyaustriella thionipta]MCU7968637.1 glycosyltransferase family 4 protein [gamma proteoba